MVRTMHAQYVFASFLSRDTTYDLIVSIWRISHPTVPTGAALPDYEDAQENADESDEEAGEETGKRRRGLRRKRGKKDKALPALAAGTDVANGVEHVEGTHTPTSATRQKKAVHPITSIPASITPYPNVCLNAVFPSAPEKIYNLMFTSEVFMGDFWRTSQKLTGSFDVRHFVLSADTASDRDHCRCMD